MDRKEEQKEPEGQQVVDLSAKDVVFPISKRNTNIHTIFGHDEGPPPKPKCAPLSKRLYAYKETLTKQEKKMLPRRSDPKYPEALRVHMIAHERPEPFGFVDTVDLFQLDEE